MHLGLSESQELLRRNAREFLAEASPATLVKSMWTDPLGYSPPLWRGMVDLGWTGLLVPEQYGGLGGTLVDACVLFQEIGRTLAPAPLFDAAVLGALTILHAGSDEQRQALLPGVADGSKVPVVAFTEPSGTWSPGGIATTATRDGDGYVLRGTKLFVPWAHIADPLIVIAREGSGSGEDGIRAFLVDPKAEGVRLQGLVTIARDKQFEVVVDGVRVPESAALGAPASGYRELDAAFQRATVVQVAEMVGGSQKALDMAVEYAKQRIAFGRPIGSFQAIQHKCAGMVTQVDALRVLMYEAAWKLDEGLPARIEVSLAKDYANEVYRNTTVESHHIHAGLAFTMDHDLHLYFRRVKVTEANLGDSQYHQELLAEALAL